MDKEIKVPTLCRSSYSEVVQILLTLTGNLLFKKYGICTGTLSKSEEPLIRHVKISSDLPGQLKRKLSHLGQIVSMKVGGSLWTAVHLSTR